MSVLLACLQLVQTAVGIAAAGRPVHHVSPDGILKLEYFIAKTLNAAGRYMEVLIAGGDDFDAKELEDEIAHLREALNRSR